MRKVFSTLLFFSVAVMAQTEHPPGHTHHNMSLDSAGVVMNENRDTLPEGCDAISTEHVFTIHAGRAYADGTPGTTFGMSESEVKVEPCSRITVTFVNEDEVRHQWMVHGLPKYLYPAGMFHIEAMGGQQKTGTFIVPGENKNYLIHCDMAQHMEKGMRAQLVVGNGSGDLWSVTRVTEPFFRDSYPPANSVLVVVTALLAGFVLAVIFRRRH